MCLPAKSFIASNVADADGLTLHKAEYLKLNTAPV
jgi:hypothetical protein